MLGMSPVTAGGSSEPLGFFPPLVGGGEERAFSDRLPLEPTRSHTKAVESSPNSSGDRKHLTVLPFPLARFGPQLRRCPQVDPLPGPQATALGIATFQEAPSAGAAGPLRDRGAGAARFSGGEHGAAPWPEGGHLGRGRLGKDGM